MFCLVPISIWAAQDALRNTDDYSLPSTLSPGAVILMPDGGQSVILQSLDNGDFITDIGVTISPQGVIKDGEFEGQTIVVDPKLLKTQLPDVAEIPQAPEKPALLKKPEIAPNPEKTQVKPENPLKKVVPEKTTPKKIDAPNKAQVERPEPKISPEEKKRLSLAQMLPLTTIKNQDKEPAKAKEAPKGQEPAKAKETQEPAKTKETPKAPEKKAKAMEKPEKPKPGEALRIPPEAQKTGNLSFLEGCWQGTRPEYYSKRTIKECFCFGANGSNGKRRIFDGPSRQCIGGTRAKLSPQGVLSVTSSGAACNDGEKWGGAEMVCRNSGPRTPCSWIFTDANNGRQAYEIPFVRVESCGR